MSISTDHPACGAYCGCDGRKPRCLTPDPFASAESTITASTVLTPSQVNGGLTEALRMVNNSVGYRFAGDVVPFGKPMVELARLAVLQAQRTLRERDSGTDHETYLSTAAAALYLAADDSTEDQDREYARLNDAIKNVLADLRSARQENATLKETMSAQLTGCAV